MLVIEDKQKKVHRDDQKRLARNTLILYIRSLFTMAVGIYTSRVILDILGVEDYGIYSLIGGFVGLFQMVSATFISTTQRYLSFEIGRKDVLRVRETFTASLRIHIFLSLFLLILFETIGVYLFYTILDIPLERRSAAMWVFQFSIASFLVNIISMPYNALIISKERMDIFAYVSIYEVLAKLGILYLLSSVPYDNLSTYAAFIFLIALSIRLFWGVYCKCKVPESQMTHVKDRGIYKSMLNFSGWILFGSSASIFTNSGINILLNVFFGVTINAAKGIASQIEHAITVLVNNFTMSLRPQITKAYASGDIQYVWSLVDKGSRMSFFLMTVMVVPILSVTQPILSIWLKVVPGYTKEFIYVILIYILLSPLKTILDMVLLAEGNVRKWQIVSSIIDFSNLPLCYLVFICGVDSYVCYIVMLVVSMMSLVNRLYFCRKNVGLSILSYINKIFCKSWGVFIITIMISMFLQQIDLGSNWLQVIVGGNLSFLTTLIIVWMLGLKANEQRAIMEAVKKRWMKTNK